MHNLLQSIQLMTNGLAMFRNDCLEGLHVNTARIQDAFSKSLVTATALAPTLGYHTVADLVNEALRTQTPLRDLVASKNLMPKKIVDKLLSPQHMIKPMPIDPGLVKKYHRG